MASQATASSLPTFMRSDASHAAVLPDRDADAELELEAAPLTSNRGASHENEVAAATDGNGLVRRCRWSLFSAVVAASLVSIAAHTAYNVGRADGSAAAINMLQDALSADRAQASLENCLRVSGNQAACVDARLSPLSTPQPSPPAFSLPTQRPPAEHSAILTLTCHDAGDGGACNDPLPPDEVLKPFRQPGWGTSLCRKPVYPEPFDFIGAPRVTAHPFWSCDNAWEIADHHALDWPVFECPVDISSFRCGDTVFFHTPPERLASWLRNEHKAIRWPYIIISCNFDVPPPFADAVAEMLTQPADNPKIWAWYGQNVGVLGPIPRAHSLPAGLPSGGWRAGNRERDRHVYYVDPMQARAALRQKLVSYLDGSWFLNHTNEDTVFASFTIGFNVAERQPVADAAKRLGSGERHISEDDYPAALKRALFVLAPGGVGVDVYRVTEAVVAGSIPILREHYWPVGYYDGWPRLVVGHWEDLTHDWLRSAAEAALAMLDANQFDFRRAYGAFQIARIRREQARAREWCAAHGETEHNKTLPVLS